MKRFCLRNIDALHLSVTRNNLIAPLILGSSADFKRSHSVAFQNRDEILHVFQCIALFIPLASRHSQNNRKIRAAGLPDRIENLAQQAGPVIQASAVTVRPFVSHRR